jgi:capsular polysaccharide biosynthesis protein
VFPERLSLAEQAQCFNNASVIFAPHGAGLTNIVFCKPGTKVVEFYGAHIAPCYWAISTIMGLEYYTEFCSPGEGMGGNDASTLAARRSAGFAVDVERLTQLLEMVGVD